MSVKLSNTIASDETLARRIVAGSKRKSYKRFFYEDPCIQGSYVIDPISFIDDRNPMQVSVNRTKTISEKEVHILHKKQEIKRIEDGLTYHGYAEILAEVCYFKNCKIEPDTKEGLEPYHANINYPIPQSSKEDDNQIAAELAKKSYFVKYMEN